MNLDSVTVLRVSCASPPRPCSSHVIVPCVSESSSVRHRASPHAAPLSFPVLYATVLTAAVLAPAMVAKPETVLVPPASVVPAARAEERAS